MHSHVVQFNIRKAEIALRETGHCNTRGVRQRCVFENDPAGAIAASIVDDSHLSVSQAVAQQQEAASEAQSISWIIQQ